MGEVASAWLRCRLDMGMFSDEVTSLTRQSRAGGRNLCSSRGLVSVQMASMKAP